MSQAVHSSAKVDVVIPARNAEATIARTLASMAGARDLINRVILVNDGSTDATVAEAKKAAEAAGLSITVVHGPGRGVSGARNLGLDCVEAPLTYLIDADDEMQAVGFRALVAALIADPEAALAVGNCIDLDGDKLSVHCAELTLGSPQEVAARYVAWRTPVIRVGSAVVRSAVLASIRFPLFRIAEDLVFWTRVLADGPALYVNRPTMTYHIDRTRYAERASIDPRGDYLAFAQAVKGLRRLGLPREALVRSRAYLVWHLFERNAAGAPRPLLASLARGTAAGGLTCREQISLLKALFALPDKTAFGLFCGALIRALLHARAGGRLWRRPKPSPPV